MGDRPIHIKFAEPEGDSPLIERISRIIVDWFPEIDPDEAEDCAGEVVMLLQRWTLNDSDELPPFLARHIRRQASALHEGTDQP